MMIHHRVRSVLTGTADTQAVVGQRAAVLCPVVRHQNPTARSHTLRPRMYPSRAPMPFRKSRIASRNSECSARRPKSHFGGPFNRPKGQFLLAPFGRRTAHGIAYEGLVSVSDGHGGTPVALGPSQRRKTSTGSGVGDRCPASRSEVEQHGRVFVVFCISRHVGRARGAGGSRPTPAEEARAEDSSSLNWQVNRSPKAGQRPRLGQKESACDRGALRHGTE
jgi:hypothetical protein